MKIPDKIMNIELLNQVKERILAEPELFTMCGYYGKKDCGTTHCIAGWAVYLHEGDEGLHLSRFHQRACDALGITDDHGYGLFYDDNWPHDLGDAYNKNYYDYVTRAQIAAQAIERFVAEPWGSRP